MLKTKFKSHAVPALVLAGLVCLWSTQAFAQTPEEPDPPQVEIPGAPGFINDMVNQTELTAKQVEQMRSGTGWGNIMIATRLAEQIAANSVEPDKLTFDEALAIVLETRAQGKGWGQIAHEHDLKVGEVVEGQEGANGGSRPRYISALIEKTELTQEQIEQMRSNGIGWGNIMIAARLAERIAADSVEPDELTFEEALEAVLAARAEGKGFGEIANENDLKVGRLIRNRNQSPAGPNGNVEQAGIRQQEKKQNIFGRFFGMLGLGRSNKAEKPAKIERAEKPKRPNKPEKLEKPERPEKPEKPEKPERPEKPEKPEKPERPERPAKPEKPEKPERGPRR